jgi:energy-coupling factor transporter transmembrane protein EcfT
MFYVPKEGFTSGYIWLVTPDTPIIGIITGGIPLSLQGAVYGLIQSLRILAMVNASVALVMTTPFNRIIIGLRQLGIPSVFAFMLATAVRFVPTIMWNIR